MSTTLGSLQVSLDYSRRKSCSATLEHRNTRNRSWVPIKAPYSPPVTPPELDEAQLQETTYFDAQLRSFEAIPDVTVAVIGTGYGMSIRI